MKNLYKPKNLQYFLSEFKNRILLILLFILILIIAISFRLHLMQVVQHEHHVTKADKNRIHLKPIPPIRGKIFDRKGRVLAGNTQYYNLGLVIERSTNLKQTLDKIRGIISISDNDLLKFEKNREYTRAYEPVVLKRRLSEIEIAKIEVNQHQLSGIEILTQHDRYYTHAKAFAHVTGYVGRINKEELKTIDKGNYMLTSHIGKTGVEKSYEKILHGTTGYKKVETNSHGKILRTLEVTNPVSGSNIYLTIDIDLQELAMRLMQNKRGSVIAFNPQNFETLVMLSSPGFDTNLFVNGISHKEYNKLRDSIDLPLFNRAINGKYPPGSVIKPFVGLAGLESGLIKAKDKIRCHGYYQIQNTKHKFRDWKRSGHGYTDMQKAIAESCDVYFFDLAYNLGIDQIKAYVNLFGFGKKTNIDLPHESSGFIPSKEWKKKQQNPEWNPGETLNVGIGQGKLQITPIQIAYATAILANYGKSYKPTLVYRISPSAQTKTNTEDTAKKIAIKDIRNWELMIDAMQKVVHSNRGTAHNINVKDSYKIAGKTGTAQVFTVKQNQKYDEKNLDARLHDHALFIAFAPITEPKIAIAVIVENGKHGSTTAAPIARSIMDNYLLNILPTNNDQPA